MEKLKFIKNVVIVLLAVGVTFILLSYVKARQSIENPIDTENQNTNEEESLSLISEKGVEIIVVSPLEDAVVSSPLTISGKAPGNWFFEASAPVSITDKDGLVIGQSYISAKGDWMTTEYVSFEGNIEFNANESDEYGFLVLKKDNPSGEPQFDDEVQYKIMFK